MDLQINPHAHLLAAFLAGCRIQAWHLNDGAPNSNDGRWDTLTPPEGREPEFGCASHLYRVHPEDEAQALAAWNYGYPTMHLPEGVRFYIERLVSNTDPAGMVRNNLQLREEVQRLTALVLESDDARPVQKAGKEKALAEFTDYFVKNYPGPNTIISDPNWHAPRIFRAAVRAMEAAP